MCTTGHISAANPHGRTPSPSTGLIFWICPLWYFVSAIVTCVRTELRLSSWQPVQETRSPGMPVTHERISWSAAPSASSGWSEIGVLAGISKQQEPSDSTSTVPSTRLMSQPDSTRSSPGVECPPVLW